MAGYATNRLIESVKRQETPFLKIDTYIDSLNQAFKGKWEFMQIDGNIYNMPISE